MRFIKWLNLTAALRNQLVCNPFFHISIINFYIITQSNIYMHAYLWNGIDT